MAYSENTSQLGTFRASADYSVDHDATSNQFRILILGTTAGEVTRSGVGATNIPIGILENKPGAQQSAVVTELQKGGIAKVQFATGQNIAIGDVISSDADGRAVEATVGDSAIGYAMEADAATVDGQVMTVMLVPHIAP
jgi:hypothetical protein